MLLASLGQGYMAMAWAGLVAVVVRILGANIVQPMPWAFRPTLVGWRDILFFGAWSTATGIVNVIHDTLPQLIIGRVLGTVPVGLFSRAQTVCQLPDKLISSALHPIVLPALAEHARRGGSLKEPYLLGLSTCTTCRGAWSCRRPRCRGSARTSGCWWRGRTAASPAPGSRA